MPGVAEALRVSQPFKLVSREVKEEDTVIDVGGVPLGGKAIAVMAGPCSVESQGPDPRGGARGEGGGRDLPARRRVQAAHEPYEFQGLREEGLKLLALAREATGLKVVTEVKDTETLPMVAEYADVLQVGARNMQNYSLLEKLGAIDKPILLKRGLSATLKEWLMAAEYIVSKGNYQVALCERGIRTFETMTRNTLDINAIPVLKALTPPAGDGGSVARDRAAAARAGDRARRRRRGRGRPHHRGPPAPGEGALGRPPVAHPRRVRGADAAGARHRGRDRPPRRG